MLKDDLKKLSPVELKLFMSANFVNPNANFTISLLTNVLGIGIWAIIDWFQIKELTKQYNFNKAEQILDIIKG